MLLILCLLSIFAQSFANPDGGWSSQYIEPRNFDLSKLLGNWYEYARTPNVFEPDHVCVNYTFLINDDKNAVMHIDATIRVSGAWYIYEGDLLPTDTTGIFDLKFRPYASYDSLIETFVDADWDHWVIYLLSSKESSNDQPLAWVLSKHPVLDERQLRKVRRVLERINVPWSSLQRVDNHDCPKQRPFMPVPY